MFQPVSHHQVLLLSGNCCTFFAPFLYLIFSVQYSAVHYVFLVSCVLALCIAVIVTVTVTAIHRASTQDTKNHKRCTLNIKYKKGAKKVQQFPDSNNT
jgi:multisubunit Na+/H+ antiporter MnhG subunit